MSKEETRVELDPIEAGRNLDKFVTDLERTERALGEIARKEQVRAETHRFRERWFARVAVIAGIALIGISRLPRPDWVEGARWLDWTAIAAAAILPLTFIAILRVRRAIELFGRRDQRRDAELTFSHIVSEAHRPLFDELGHDDPAIVGRATIRAIRRFQHYAQSRRAMRSLRGYEAYLQEEYRKEIRILTGIALATSLLFAFLSLAGIASLDRLYTVSPLIGALVPIFLLISPGQSMPDFSLPSLRSFIGESAEGNGGGFDELGGATRSAVEDIHWPLLDEIDPAPRLAESLRAIKMELNDKRDMPSFGFRRPPTTEAGSQEGKQTAGPIQSVSAPTHVSVGPTVQSVRITQARGTPRIATAAHAASRASPPLAVPATRASAGVKRATAMQFAQSRKLALGSTGGLRFK